VPLLWSCERLGVRCGNVPGSIRRFGSSARHDSAHTAQLTVDAQLSHPQKELASQMHNGGLPSPVSPKPHILLVEDETVLRGHLARVLSDEYIVDTAGNGKEALECVLRSPPALVVTDIVMPTFDGIELLKALRSSEHTGMIPVLLISGLAIHEQRIEG